MIYLNGRVIQPLGLTDNSAPIFFMDKFFETAYFAISGNIVEKRCFQNNLQDIDQNSSEPEKPVTDGLFCWDLTQIWAATFIQSVNKLARQIKCNWSTET